MRPSSADELITINITFHVIGHSLTLSTKINFVEMVKYQLMKGHEPELTLSLKEVVYSLFIYLFIFEGKKWNDNFLVRFVFHWYTL